MAKETKPKRDDKEQSKRFIETARKLKVDKSGKPFERALTNIVQEKAKSPKQVR